VLKANDSATLHMVHPVCVGTNGLSSYLRDTTLDEEIDCDLEQ
jgi:hypothetical protein